MTPGIALGVAGPRALRQDDESGPVLEHGLAHEPICPCNVGLRIPCCRQHLNRRHVQASIRVRFDHDQHLNLIWKTCGEEFIFKGRNTMTHNIVADLRACLPTGGQPSRGFLVMPYGKVDRTIVQQNIFYCTDPDMSVLTEGRRDGRLLSLLRNCRADQNPYYCSSDPQWARAHVQEQCRYGVECESRVADPRFADPDHGDFRLLSDSPAHEMGIEPLPMPRFDRTIFPFNE